MGSLMAGWDSRVMDSKKVSVIVVFVRSKSLTRKEIENNWRFKRKSEEEHLMAVATLEARIWESPEKFRPERFVVTEGEENVDVRGNDLRLAPFGAGHRVCPGKALGLATVQLWVAKLFHHFQWFADPRHPADLGEVLKLSCEMLNGSSASCNSCFQSALLILGVEATMEPI
eukprot:Gb_40064 [translate_table: standard]